MHLKHIVVIRCCLWSCLENYQILDLLNIKNKSLSFVITHRDQKFTCKIRRRCDSFVKSQGISETEVNDWKEQINRAEKEGRFGFTSFPVLTEAYLNKSDNATFFLELNIRYFLKVKSSFYKLIILIIRMRY